MNVSTNDSFNFAQHIRRTQTTTEPRTIRKTLSARQWPTRLHDYMLISTCFATSQLNRLSIEIIIEILLQLDNPPLTRFRSLSCRAVQFVDSVRQYTAIIEHCPDILRAIVSIRADAFDCVTLYRALFTTQCSTFNRFGNYLYLTDCRVCYLCFTKRPEVFPSQVAKHTSSSPSTQRTIPGAFVNSSSWRNHQAS